MMTRNDFELLANALKSERATIILAQANVACADGILEARLQSFDAAVNVVAGVCVANNSRFQRGRFFDACGVDSSECPGCDFPIFDCRCDIES